MPGYVLKINTGKSMGKILFSILAFVYVISVSADETARPQNTESREDVPKKIKPSVLNVAKELKSLLKTSDMAEKIADKKQQPPYLKVIKGKDGKATLIYRCRNSKAKSLLNALEGIVSTHGIVEQSEEQNLVIVNDNSEKIEEVKKAVLGLDINTPQILVEAKVVEVLLSDGQQRDVDITFNRHDRKQNLDSKAGFGTNAASTIASGGEMNWYPYVAGEVGDSVYKNLNTTIKWLITANDAKVLSAPNLVVSLGATASIVTGQDIPIQTIQVVSGSTTTSTKFKRVGVTLNVTPNIINDNSVNLTVNPQVSNVQRYENIQQNEGTYPVPVISIRNIQTELTLKDGQIVMLGGLYSHTEKDNEDRVPFLSDLPFVGELFTGKNQSKELTQLIFFLKINILSPREIADGIIYDPGKQAQTIRKVGDIIKNSKQIFPHKDELEVEKFKKELMDGRGSKKFMKAIDGKD